MPSATLQRNFIAPFRCCWEPGVHLKNNPDATEECNVVATCSFPQKKILTNWQTPRTSDWTDFGFLIFSKSAALASANETACNFLAFLLAIVAIDV